MRRILHPILVVGLAVLPALACPAIAPAQDKVFRAGAAAVDIAPGHYPVIVNGGFLAARATRSNDPIRARSLVLDDGTTRLAIVVVDSCMMPRELIDRAKSLGSEKTGIPVDRMLISATHTHSAPAVMGALGTPPDAGYAATLPARIAAAIERAAANLEPARAGWGAVDDHEHTFCRRWIRRPDRMLDDPFGRRNVRANMHPGYQNPDAIAPSGPVDPALTVLSVQSRSGRPIAVLVNYSMHYYGADPVSADYYGRFAAALARRIGASAGTASGGTPFQAVGKDPGQDARATEDHGQDARATSPPFVGIMSQGTSGDQMWMDYGRPKKDPGLDAYADAVAASAERAYRAIAYQEHVPLVMAETTLILGRRLPDEESLALARRVIADMEDRDFPRNLLEVYSREAVYLHDEPSRELKLQAIRIGELGITAIPNEVYAITGLKLKAHSPFNLTMNIELANGSEGYIPPPEQHALGGYTTWPARTAGLEVQAEPKIVAAVLKLLEQVAGKPRRVIRVPQTPYANAVLASKPTAYWRLDDIEGTAARDSSGHDRPATYEGGYAPFLPGADAPGLSAGNRLNRAVHFAGGLLKAPLDSLPETYTLELWFWNGLTEDTRPDGDLFFFHVPPPKSPGDHLGVGGARTQLAPRRLFFMAGMTDAIALVGRTEIAPRTWHHVAVVRTRKRVAAYLDGSQEPDMAVDTLPDPVKGAGWLFIGGGSRVTYKDDGKIIGGRIGVTSNFEGKIDEVALYDRALDAAEVAAHYRAAGVVAGTGRSVPEREAPATSAPAR